MVTVYKFEKIMGRTDFMITFEKYVTNVFAKI